MKNEKSKKINSILRLLLSCFLSVWVFFTSVLGSYCSGTTDSGNSDDSWEMTAYRFLELAFTGYAKEISAPFVIWETLGNPSASFEGFQEWEHEHGLDIPLNELYVKGDHGGGHTRDSQKINSSTQIDVPDEVAQEVLNYIHFEVQQNPLSYVETRIPSYLYINPSIFPNYTMYNAVKDYMKNKDGWHAVISYGMSNQQLSYLQIMTISKSRNVGWVGGTATGQWSTVYPYVDWVKITSSNYRNYTVSVVNVNANGSTTTNPTYIGLVDNISYSNMNITSIATITSKYPVFTSTDNNEYVYVFNNLNAYKAYNSGSPQPYYLTEQGMNNSNWTVGSGIINTGSMLNSGNYYNYIINNSAPGMDPDEVLKLIEKLLDMISDGTVGGGSGGNDGSFNLDFLGTIGNLIGSLISGLGGLITGILSGIVDALSSVIELVTQALTNLTELISSNISDFFSGVFDWLPEEIVTLIISSITLTVFIGVIKLIRG